MSGEIPFPGSETKEKTESDVLRAIDLSLFHLTMEQVGEMEEIRADFNKCADVALVLDAMNPEAPEAFKGTVSERLRRGVDRLNADLEEIRHRHGNFMRRIKKMLGHKNWPEFEGDFLEGVANLLEQKMKNQKVIGKDNCG